MHALWDNHWVGNAFEIGHDAAPELGKSRSRDMSVARRQVGFIPAIEIRRRRAATSVGSRYYNYSQIYISLPYSTSCVSLKANWMIKIVCDGQVEIVERVPDVKECETPELWKFHSTRRYFLKTSNQKCRYCIT